MTNPFDLTGRTALLQLLSHSRRLPKSPRGTCIKR
jgi:hypothetical protein